MTYTDQETMDLLADPDRSRREDEFLKEAAAQPSTALIVLRALLPSCADEVLLNPAFRLALATDSTLISRLSPRGKAAIAGSKVAEPGLIRMLAARRTRPIQSRVAAAGNTACPPDMLWDFLKHRCPVRCSLAQNPAIPDALLAALCEDDSWRVRGRVAQRPTLTQALFDQFAADGEWQVRQCLASNPALPDRIKDVLVYDPYYRVRASLAGRQDLGEHRLLLMAEREKGITVLRKILLNPSTPLAVLEERLRLALIVVERNHLVEDREVAPLLDVSRKGGRFSKAEWVQFSGKKCTHSAANSRSLGTMGLRGFCPP